MTDSMLLPLELDLVFLDLGRSLGKDILITVFPVLHLALCLVVGDAVVFLDIAY